LGELGEAAPGGAGAAAVAAGLAMFGSLFDETDDNSTPSEDSSLVPPLLIEDDPLKSAEDMQAHLPTVPTETIQGIGPVYGDKLKENNIHSVSDLLAFGASRKGRVELAEKTGISHALILKWVNMADLMRISGIDEEYSQLLEYAGVDTVKELRNRNPEHLYQAMIEANQNRKLVRRTLYLSDVQSWVEQAKHLDPLMTY
jgi:predicted flap endonuclease-1-like 5' DNA nuclease